MLGKIEKVLCKSRSRHLCTQAISRAWKAGRAPQRAPRKAKLCRSTASTAALVHAASQPTRCMACAAATAAPSLTCAVGCQYERLPRIAEEIWDQAGDRSWQADHRKYSGGGDKWQTTSGKNRHGRAARRLTESSSSSMRCSARYQASSAASLTAASSADAACLRARQHASHSLRSSSRCRHQATGRAHARNAPSSAC